MANDELRAWLAGISLDKYADVFIENEITTDELPDLTEADLIEMGLPIGPRRRLLRVVSEKAPVGVAQKPPSGPNKASAGAERRRMTVMFCDLVDSTALAEQLDPEELRDYLAVFRSACESEISQVQATPVCGVRVCRADDVFSIIQAALINDR